jgi:hypothetical protein
MTSGLDLSVQTWKFEVRNLLTPMIATRSIRLSNPAP